MSAKGKPDTLTCVVGVARCTYIMSTWVLPHRAPASLPSLYFLQTAFLPSCRTHHKVLCMTVHQMLMQSKHEDGCSDTGCSQKSSSSTQSMSPGSRRPYHLLRQLPSGITSTQPELMLRQLRPGLSQSRFQALKLPSQAPPLICPT